MYNILRVDMTVTPEGDQRLEISGDHTGTVGISLADPIAARKLVQDTFRRFESVTPWPSDSCGPWRELVCQWVRGF